MNAQTENAGKTRNAQAPPHSYRVRFLKQVCGDFGNEELSEQGSFDVSAISDAEAFETGWKRFARQRGTRNWALYADIAEVERLA